MHRKQMNRSLNIRNLSALLDVFNNESHKAFFHVLQQIGYVKNPTKNILTLKFKQGEYLHIITSKIKQLNKEKIITDTLAQVIIDAFTIICNENKFAIILSNNNKVVVYKYKMNDCEIGIDWNRFDFKTLTRKMPDQTLQCILQTIRRPEFKDSLHSIYVKRILYNAGINFTPSSFGPKTLYSLIVKYNIPLNKPALIHHCNWFFKQCVLSHGNHPRQATQKLEQDIKNVSVNKLPAYNQLRQHEIDTCKSLLYHKDYNYRTWLCYYCWKWNKNSRICCQFCNLGMNPYFWAKANKSRTFSVAKPFGIIRFKTHVK